MELFNMLNELEELIDNCPRVPMTNKVLVDEEQLLDHLDRVRTSLPEEVRQAKWIVEEREKMLADAKEEAQRVVKDAKEEMQSRVEESEIVKQAQELSDEQQKQAEEVAAEIKRGAHQYADDILGGLEEQLVRFLEEIKQGRSELRVEKKQKAE
ncbi:MAG: ATPase [Clostridiales bacterium]|nr:ATPase [Clostridiales bacterium]MCF8022583.1 ATPase [Clostridiales bacterium]